jgi:uncharacterized protein related to proFAR isomerase
MTFDIPFFIVKDKQAFRKDEGRLRQIGSPTQIVRKLADSGAKLIHIIDMDAKKGITTNMDIYDKLTYFVNIEVECSEKADMIERLIHVKARVVLELSTKRDLLKWKEHERLMVGMVKPDYSQDAEGVHDVIIEDANNATIERFDKLGKRIIVFETDHRKLDTEHKKLVWGVLKPI